MLNKLLLFAFFLVLLICTSTSAQRLTSFVDHNLLGYKDGRGRVVIPARFIMAGDFSKAGLAIVVDERGWALIDRTGRVVIRTPFIFDGGPDDFAEGLARLTAGDKMGFYDQTGRTIIEPQYDFALPFQEGLAAVCSGCRKTGLDAEGHYSVISGRWGYINRRGALVIPFKFEEANSFSGGRALVTVDGRQVPINKRGTVMK